MSNENFLNCRVGTNNSEIIRLGHGSGGKMTASLIESVFLPALGNETLNQLDDAAVIKARDTTIAFTTDAYVVSPLFFPGGNIGSLAVHGTVNDLAMRGAKPLFLSASFILEEGFPIAELNQIIASMSAACADAHVQLVAADTKVVDKNSADKLFITTSGIGVIEHLPAPSASRAKPGDAILLSGDIGRHGIAVMACRENLELETAILSDSCPLDKVVHAMLTQTNAVNCLRDITRGGLAGVLNELVAASKVGIEIEEELIPIHPEVKAVCELLGLDPLYVACEGRLVAIVPAEHANTMLEIMRKQTHSENSVCIGKVVAEHSERVVMRSIVGGSRIVDKLSGEQLPRIC